MVTSAANDRWAREPAVEMTGGFQWANLSPASGGDARLPPAATGCVVIEPPRKAGVEGSADTAILGCLGVIDAHLRSGAGLARLAGAQAELLALLNAPQRAPRLAGESWLRLGVLALLGEAGIDQAAAAARQALQLAVEGGEVSLQLSCLALLGVADAFAGRVVRADVRLGDALFLCAHRDATPLARLAVRGAAGLVALMLGDAARAHAELTSAACLADAAGLPDSVQVFLLGHRLYASAALGREAESAGLASRLGEACIPAGRGLLWSYRHLALGVLALRSGQALRALERADACIEQALAGGVGLLSALGTLLRLQALADLQRGQEAREVFRLASAGWLAAGLNRLAAVARQELAMLDARTGARDRARAGLAAARGLVPAGETLRPLHRPRAWVDELEALLGSTGVQPRVRIQTLGEFIVEIDGRRIYDRDWKGQRTRMLLVALICEGGQKVPATRLADMLWPDAEGDKALQNLKVALHRLRRLGCREGDEVVNWVHVKQGMVSLVRGACRVDVHEIEAGSVPPPSVSAGIFLDGACEAPWVSAYRLRVGKLIR